MKRLFLFVALLCACVCLIAQSVQYGYTEQYNGVKDKTPLPGVNINAGGATARSGADGKFKLSFNTLKVGDPVNADVSSVANLKGYILFNKEAVEQWTVSGKSSYFRIVLCKKSDFDAAVRCYYNVSDRSYKEQLRRERARAEQMMKEGAVRQAEYEQLLKEAEERYQRAQSVLEEYAELVARIDENELEGDQQEVLRLAKEGRMDEAVELIRKGNTVELLAKSMAKGEYAQGQQEFYAQKEAEAKAEMKSIAGKMKTNIKILQLAGGKENLDLCGDFWQRIVAADTTDLENLWSAARFFEQQNRFLTAERYYEMALAICKLTVNENPSEYNRYNYVYRLSKVAHVYRILHRESKLRESFQLMVSEYAALQRSGYINNGGGIRLVKLLQDIMDVIKDNGDITSIDIPRIIGMVRENFMQTTEGKAYFVDILQSAFSTFMAKGEYGEAENYIREASVIVSDLYIVDKMLYGHKLIDVLNSYSCLPDKNRNEYYQKALNFSRAMYAENPDAYRPDLANTLYLYACYFVQNAQYDSAETFFREAIELQQTLVNSEPDAYTSALLNSMNGLAAMYIDVDQIANAKSTFRSALLIERQSEYAAALWMDESLAATLNGLGVCCQRSNINDEAEEYFKQALDVRRRLYDMIPLFYAPYLAETLSNLGVVYFLTGRFAEAVKYYAEAIPLYEKLVETDPARHEAFYATTLQLYAMSCRDNGDKAKAERLFLKTLEVCKNMTRQDPGRVVDALRNFAFFYYTSENYESAKKYYMQALSICQTIMQTEPSADNANMTAFVLNDLGTACYFLDQFDESLKYTDLALYLMEQGSAGNPEFAQTIFLVTNNVSSLAILVSDFLKGEQFALKALQLNPASVEAKTNLVSALLLQGRYKEAETMAMEIKDMVSNGRTGSEIILEDLGLYEKKGVIPAARKADVRKLKSNLSNG